MAEPGGEPRIRTEERIFVPHARLGRDENVPRADRTRAGALAGVAARARDRRLGLRPRALEFLVGTARGSRARPRQAEDLDPRALLQRHLARPYRAQNPAGMFLA